MTAINATVADDGVVHLFTDGAACRPDGTLDSLTSKVIEFPHLNAVVAARGPMGFLRAVSMFIGTQAEGFDGLCAAIEPACRRLADASAAAGSLEFDLVLAGISETRGPCIFVLVNHERHGIAPWKLHPVDMALVMPSHPIEATIKAPADLLANAVEVIQAQRGVIEGWGPGQEPASRVGGFIQHTEVSRAGIQTSILARWPDKVGERIDPSVTSGGD